MNLRLEDLRKRLLREAHAGNAFAMAKYMRFQFSFFGVKTPKRREIFETWTSETIGKREDLKADVLSLWNWEEREGQYIALDLMLGNLSLFKKEDLQYFESLILTKSWWDTIDVLAPSIVGKLCERGLFSYEDLGNYWIAKDNFWLQRSAILLQLKRKEKTELQILFDWILYRATSSEFFVQKAAGWALREASKSHNQRVLEFLRENNKSLSPLTIREASKYLL